MKKKSLSDWAAIAEITGTVAILVSLIFVVVSIRQNTAELRLQNENFVFELQDSAQADFVSNPWLVDISIKIDNGEELTQSEYRRFFAHSVRFVSHWEMIFYWNRDGNIEEQSWLDWDQYYSQDIESWLTKEQWAEIRSSYQTGFVEHVDSKYK
jgi:hypothetical protein